MVTKPPIVNLYATEISILQNIRCHLPNTNATFNNQSVCLTMLKIVRNSRTGKVGLVTPQPLGNRNKSIT